MCIRDRYETYFFSVVDEGDLLAAAEAAGVEQAVCSCPEKWAAGTVNTDCPVCSVTVSYTHLDVYKRQVLAVRRR